MSIMGLTDPWIWGSYAACILSVAFCCIYGFVKGRQDEDTEDDEDGS